MDGSLGRSISFGPFRLYPGARVIERDGVRLAIGSRALDILTVLVGHGGNVVSHRELTQRVWRGLVVTPSSLRVHIASLRKALGEGEEALEYIANVPGQGYCFVAPISLADADPASASAPVPQKPANVARAEPEPTECLAGPRHNLPNQLTSFIGREREIRELKGYLASTRLLTLTGAGGCGKSRLALQVAAEVLDRFPGGCWLVELAPLNDPALVAQTVANALAIDEEGSGSIAEAIARRLAAKRLLLLLDNAEHLIEPCAYLANLLLRRCGGLEILATSREPLGVNGELTYRVPSLSMPAGGDATTEAVLTSESARLFVDRARLHRHDFEITPTNVRTLASICRRLDGIALAIELAAPRLRTMSIEDLDRHLVDRFGFLTGGHRTAPPRHRTLRSLLDWSYDLLSSAEKIVLRRAAVFCGGWTVDATEFVCAGEGVERGVVLDLVGSLTDKCILVAEPRGDGTRFSMLETVRHYALDRLRESGEEETIRARHRDFFLALAEAVHAEKSEDERLLMVKRLDLDLDNLRAAFAWCDADVSRAVIGMRFAGKLSWFWYERNYFSEARSWIDRFLAATPGGEGDEDRAKALATAGSMAYHQADYVPSEAYDQEAIAIYRRLGRYDEVAGMVGNLGTLAVHRGDYTQARELLGEALAAARETGDRRLIALWLYNLGVLACSTGNFDDARLILEECVRVSREVGTWTLAYALQELGWVRHMQGQREEGLSLLKDALDRQRESGDRLRVADALYHMGMASHDSGDMPAAKAQLREALALVQTIGDRILTALVLEVLAGLALDFASPADAARLWGHAQRLREEIGAPQDPVMRGRCERHIAAAREAWHNGEAFDAAWREGRAMTLEATVRCALNF